MDSEITPQEKGVYPEFVRFGTHCMSVVNLQMSYQTTLALCE